MKSFEVVLSFDGVKEMFFFEDEEEIIGSSMDFENNIVMMNDTK